MAAALPTCGTASVCVFYQMAQGDISGLHLYLLEDWLLTMIDLTYRADESKEDMVYVIILLGETCRRSVRSAADQL